MSESTDPPPAGESSQARDPIADVLGWIGLLAGPVGGALRQVNIEQLSEWKAGAEHLLGTASRLAASLDQLQQTAEALNEQLTRIADALTDQQGSDPS